MRLSKNFTLKELTTSNTALRLGIDNTPSKEGIMKLTILATTLLQPLRNELGSIRVTSGYRSDGLNKAIGGSSRSQHCHCEAVDLQLVRRGKMDNIQIYKALINLDLDFDQCILEFGNSTQHIDPTEPAWIHLSYKITDNRKHILVAYKDESNKTKYRPLIKYKSV
jgi:zinc D-Ala-D-Ala carboxypeptidase